MATEILEPSYATTAPLRLITRNCPGAVEATEIDSSLLGVFSRGESPAGSTSVCIYYSEFHYYFRVLVCCFSGCERQLTTLRSGKKMTLIVFFPVR